MPVASTTLRAYRSSGSPAPPRCTVILKPPDALLGCSGSTRHTCGQGESRHRRVGDGCLWQGKRHCRKRCRNAMLDCSRRAAMILGYAGRQLEQLRNALLCRMSSGPGGLEVCRPLYLGAVLDGDAQHAAVPQQVLHPEWVQCKTSSPRQRMSTSHTEAQQASRLHEMCRLQSCRAATQCNLWQGAALCAFDGHPRGAAAWPSSRRDQQQQWCR